MMQQYRHTYIPRLDRLHKHAYTSLALRTLLTHCQERHAHKHARKFVLITPMWDESS